MVREGCFRVGLYRQGIMHDWSKYTPVEFLVGAKYYQGDKSPNNIERKRAFIRIALLLVILGRANPVNKHFHHVFLRHTHPRHTAVLHRIINPVFQMMLVSSLMVKPRHTVMEVQSP